MILARVKRRWAVEARRVPINGLQVGVGAEVGGDEGGEGFDPGPARQHLWRAGGGGRPSSTPTFGQEALHRKSLGEWVLNSGQLLLSDICPRLISSFSRENSIVHRYTTPFEIPEMRLEPPCIIFQLGMLPDLEFGDDQLAVNYHWGVRQILFTPLDLVRKNHGSHLSVIIWNDGNSDIYQLCI